jgi:hypothetical protein
MCHARARQARTAPAGADARRNGPKTVWRLTSAAVCRGRHPAHACEGTGPEEWPSADTPVMEVPTVHNHRTLVGLDVHARATVAAVLELESGELRFRRVCGPLRSVASYLEELPGPVLAVYEAGPVGYGLARETTPEVEVRHAPRGRSRASRDDMQDLPLDVIGPHVGSPRMWCVRRLTRSGPGGSIGRRCRSRGCPAAARGRWVTPAHSPARRRRVCAPARIRVRTALSGAGSGRVCGSAAGPSRSRPVQPARGRSNPLAAGPSRSRPVQRLVPGSARGQ